MPKQNLGILAHVSEAQAITLSDPHQATALKKKNMTFFMDLPWHDR